MAMGSWRAAVKGSSGLLLVLTFMVTSCSASLPTHPTSDTTLQINYGDGFPQFYAVGSDFVLRSFVVTSYGAYRDVSDQTTWISSSPAVVRAFPSPTPPWVFHAFALV